MNRRTRWTAVPDEPPYPMNRRTRWTAVPDEPPYAMDRRIGRTAVTWLRRPFRQIWRRGEARRARTVAGVVPAGPAGTTVPEHTRGEGCMRRSRQHRLARHRPRWVPLLDDHESITLAKVAMTAALGIAFAALPAVGAGAAAKVPLRAGDSSATNKTSPADTAICLLYTSPSPRDG